MDVVLEVFDTFLFDRAYANALPIHPSILSFDPISTIAASLKGYQDVNASWSGSIPTSDSSRSGWQYNAATQYFGLEPSEYAYMSRWDRDNIYRQTLSLYLITW